MTTFESIGIGFDFDDAVSQVIVNGGYLSLRDIYDPNMLAFLGKIIPGKGTKIIKLSSGEIIVEVPSEAPPATPLEVNTVVPVKDTAANKIEIPVTVTDPDRAEELNEIELFVAEYDDNGVLTGITLRTKATISDNTITVTADIPEGENYKFMLWDACNSPLMNPIEDVSTVTEKE